MLENIKNGLKTVGVSAGLCASIGVLATASVYFGKCAYKCVCLLLDVD